jgi:hypothetical protein
MIDELLTIRQQDTIRVKQHLSNSIQSRIISITYI